MTNADATSQASGRLSLGGGAAIHLDQTAGVNFCPLSSSSCHCPTDSNDSAATFTHIDPGTEYIGVTGGLQVAGVTLTGYPIDTFCNDICHFVPASTVSSIFGFAVGTAHSIIGGQSPRDAACRYGETLAAALAILDYVPDDVGTCRQFAAIIRGGRGYRRITTIGDNASYSETNGLLAFDGSTCILAYGVHETGTVVSPSTDADLLRALRAKL